MVKERPDHPLANHPDWIFNQPEVGYRSLYATVDRESGEKTTRTISDSNTCREGVIINSRSAFQNSMTNKATRAAKSHWSGDALEKLKVTHDVDLDNLNLEKVDKDRHRTSLRLRFTKGQQNIPSSVEEFIKVCNVVLGPVCVLFSPNRPEGDSWWKGDTGCSADPDDEFVHWYGTDNWFLNHPATMSVVLGLYRQCFHLCGAGLAKEIIKTVSEEEITEVMSSNSQRLALQLVKRTRNYIEVPVAKGGHRNNYSFSLGFWRRLIRLQRGIRRHGYANTLGQDFLEGWYIDPNESGHEWSGAFTFWGDEGNLSKHHQHLMKMGAPKRRNKVAGK